MGLVCRVAGKARPQAKKKHRTTQPCISEPGTNVNDVLSAGADRESPSCEKERQLCTQERVSSV